MRCIFIVVLFLSVLIACNNKQVHKKEIVKFQGEAQGTYYAITYIDSLGRNLQVQVDSLLDAFNLSCSIYDSTSIVSKFNRNIPNITADKCFTTVFNISQQVSKETNGAFDITVGPLVNAWGFGFKNKIKLTQFKVDSLLEFVDYKKIELKNGKIIKQSPEVVIDFNAIAQGYSVDIVSEYFESLGIKNYLIDIGGEVKGKGKKLDNSIWKVGIEKPAKNAEDGREVEAVVMLNNKSIATSGNYRKFFEENGVRYSHTIDPKTGYPAKNSLLSVSVVADSTVIADAYATSFMVMGLEKSLEFLKSHKNMEAYFIISNGDSLIIEMTDGFNRFLNK